MPVEVIFHRLAAREYRLARAWYAARSQVVADSFAAAVGIAVQRIEAAPGSLAKLVGRYCYVRVRGFPYALVFRQRDSATITILAVAHGRRLPGYWRRRHP